MSKYQGGMIGSAANTPSGTNYTGKANGIWSLPHHIAAKSALQWAIGQTKPNPPTIGSATAISATSVSVAFIPPVQDGGETITIYTVTSSSGHIVTGASSPIVVSGLTAGTNYTFTVTATNNLGTSVSSGTSNSASPISSDPYFTGVSLLLNGNSFADMSVVPKAITVNGNTSINTTTKKYGTGSYYFDGSGDYLQTASAASLALIGDQTIEYWINIPSYPAAGDASSMCTIGNALGWTSGDWNLNLGSQSGQTNKFLLWINGDASPKIASTTIPALNTWHHVALVTYNGITKLYVNGVQEGAAWTGYLTNHSSDVIYAGYKLLGYMDEIRITTGVARYTSNFTPPTSEIIAAATAQADPYYSSVSLLLNGDGSNGSTAFTDLSSSPKTVTTNGNTQISTSVVKYGTGSIYFDGAGDYLNTPASAAFAFGSGSFTVELWYYPVSVTSSWPFVWSNGNGYPTNCVSINDRHAQHNTVFSCTLGNYQPNNDTALNGSTVVTNNRWYHLALVRNGNSISLYVNGVAEATITYAGSLDGGSSEQSIIGGGTSAFCNGYIDDLRITKGVARYTSNFTPPSAALQATSTAVSGPTDPAFPAVSLLLNGETADVDANWSSVVLMLPGDDFVDWSNQRGTVTTSGTTSVSSSITKFRSGAIQLNGTGTTYLSIPSSTALNMTGDFTMEYWAYFTDLTTNPVVLSKWANGNFSYHVAHSTAAGEGFAFIYSTTGGGGGGIVFVYSGIAPVLNTWTHFAASVSGTTLRMFVNGTLVKTTTISSIYAGTEKLTIGNNGDPGYSTNAKMVLSDIRITKGVARYTADFTPPTSALPAFKITNRSTYATTITPYGNVQLSSAQKKYGNTSMYFDGSGDCLTLPSSSNFAFGTADFTVDYWIYYTSSSTAYGHCVLDTRTANGNATGIAFSTMNNGAAEIYTNTEKAIAGTATINTWNHYAFVRSSGVLTGYINGVPVFSIAFTQNLSDTTCVIGSNNPRNTWTTGYIDDLRITKGLARYTSAFVPPAQALPTS